MEKWKFDIICIRARSAVIEQYNWVMLFLSYTFIYIFHRYFGAIMKKKCFRERVIVQNAYFHKHLCKSFQGGEKMCPTFNIRQYTTLPKSMLAHDQCRFVQYRKMINFTRVRFKFVLYLTFTLCTNARSNSQSSCQIVKRTCSNNHNFFHGQGMNCIITIIPHIVIGEIQSEIAIFSNQNQCNRMNLTPCCSEQMALLIELLYFVLWQATKRHLILFAYLLLIFTHTNIQLSRQFFVYFIRIQRKRIT